MLESFINFAKEFGELLKNNHIRWSIMIKNGEANILFHDMSGENNQEIGAEMYNVLIGSEHQNERLSITANEFHALCLKYRLRCNIQPSKTKILDLFLNDFSSGMKRDSIGFHEIIGAELTEWEEYEKQEN